MKRIVLLLLATTLLAGPAMAQYEGNPGFGTESAAHRDGGPHVPPAKAHHKKHHKHKHKHKKHHS